MPQSLHLAALPGGRIVPSAPQVYHEIRRNTSLAAGIEAIAAQAIDQGEATHDQLEHVASLSLMLRQDLERLAVAMAEISGSRRDD